MPDERLVAQRRGVLTFVVPSIGATQAGNRADHGVAVGVRPAIPFHAFQVIHGADRASGAFPGGLTGGGGTMRG